MGSCDVEDEAELLADVVLDVAELAPGGGGGPEGSVPSPSRLLMNEARSADRSEVLLLLAVAPVVAEAVAVPLAALLAVLSALPADCKFTKNDCRSVMSCEADAISLDEAELLVALLSDASLVASGGGPGGGPGGGANCVMLVAELALEFVAAVAASVCARCCCNNCHCDRAVAELETDPMAIVALPNLLNGGQQRLCHVKTSVVGGYSAILARHFLPGGMVCPAGSDKQRSIGTSVPVREQSVIRQSSALRADHGKGRITAVRF